MSSVENKVLPSARGIRKGYAGSDTLLACELDKESNRGRDLSIVHRRGPIDDFLEHIRTNRRHGRPQLLFSNHEIWESDSHAVERLVNERVWVYETLTCGARRIG